MEVTNNLYSGLSASTKTKAENLYNYPSLNVLENPPASNDTHHTVNFQPELLLEKISNCATKFVFALHNNNNFSRKDVFEIQETAKQFLIDPLLDLFKLFAVHKIELDVCAQNELCGLISKCRNPFKHLNTDYLLYKWLNEGDYAKNITEFTIDNQVTTVHRKGKLVYDEKTIKGVVMPLKFQFRKTFEKDDLLFRTLGNIELLKNDTRFSNFVQGKLWQQKMALYPNKTIIPYFLYVDDFEINNPLGSHAGTQSVCNLYYSFPCLPGESSKVENIFFAGTIKSTDIKTHGNEKCFEFLVEQLKDLEINGIDIKTSQNLNPIRRVHFILGLVLGDNLGLNGFLGFNKSFVSKSYCRICKAVKEDCQKLTSENSDLIRTVTNYESDVQLKNIVETGIESNSILNSIPSFHVVDNSYVDIMHDLFEGVCHYDLCHIIPHFIKMKYFDLETLNSRKRTFEYGRHEIGNISGDIKQLHLDKKKLKMSAREMMSFIIFFPLMVGDFVPADDDVWKFLINFVEIIDIILCFEIHESNLTLLENKIKKHHEDYILLFRDTLKPKFHNFVHVVRVLRNSGPLRKLWCFNYETKHRQFKIYSHCITSRKNICLTLAKKYQLKFANYLIHQDTNLEESSVCLNPKHEIGSKFLNIILSKLNSKETELKFYSKIVYRGHDIIPTDYIATFEEDIYIYKIIEITLFRNSVLLFAQKLERVEYNPHYVAYVVDPNILGQLKFIPANNIIGPPLSLIKTARGICMLRIKEYYKPIA
ncbi:uncharacterized protein LOC116181772 isoform X1 [Photinus pyralis]|uniref:uncharacterized protein LOC116181772 isoform X1 n=1 Tax=Photinus pyralis TaxID=7054 RepID=UPI00126769E3|nr:uncharacterized protein LOC116181772 isoform X1 [Photinus pyralis]